MLKKRKNSSYWWYRFRFEGRVYEASTKMTVKEEAKKVAYAVRLRLAQEAAGIAPAVVKGRPPMFGDYAATWIESYKVAAERGGAVNTWKYYENSLKRLLPWFSSRRLDEITAADVEAYKRARMAELCVRGGRRGAEVSNRTVNIEINAVRVLFNHAISSEQFRPFSNPAAKGKVKRLPQAQKMRIPTRQELDRYFAELAPTGKQRGAGSADAYDICKLIELQGCRPHEVMGLRVADTDFNLNLIRVAHKERGSAVVVRGKTKQAERELYMRGEAREILLRRAQAAGPDRGALLFPSKMEGRAGEPINDIHSAHWSAIRRAGIEAPAFQIYDLRHYFATDALARGVDVGTLRDLMGHSDIHTTMRYVHPAAAAKRAAMILLDGGDAGAPVA